MFTSPIFLKTSLVKSISYNVTALPVRVLWPNDFNNLGAKTVFTWYAPVIK